MAFKSTIKFHLLEFPVFQPELLPPVLSPPVSLRSPALLCTLLMSPCAGPAPSALPCPSWTCSHVSMPRTRELQTGHGVQLWSQKRKRERSSRLLPGQWDFLMLTTMLPIQRFLQCPPSHPNWGRVWRTSLLRSG